jgi:hypothetical protein
MWQTKQRNEKTSRHIGNMHISSHSRDISGVTTPSGALIHVCVVAVAIVDDDKLKIEFQSSARREGAASAWLRLLHVGRALMNK